MLQPALLTAKLSIAPRQYTQYIVCGTWHLAADLLYLYGRAEAQACVQPLYALLARKRQKDGQRHCRKII